MKFVSLVFKGKSNVLSVIVFLGLLSGGMHVALIATINEIINSLLKGDRITVRTLAFSIALVLIYLAINRVLSKKMINLSQKIVHDLRMKILRSLHTCPYEEIYRKREVVTAAVIKDTVSLSRAPYHQSIS